MALTSPAVTTKSMQRDLAPAGVLNLNIHSLWALIRSRPELAATVASDLDIAITRLQDDNQDRACQGQPDW
jgi:hypothetical protein